MKGLHMVAFIILVIGGLNWGLEIFEVGIGNYLNPTISNIIYALVALSAIYEVVTHKANCKSCNASAIAAPTV